MARVTVTQVEPQGAGRRKLRFEGRCGAWVRDRSLRIAPDKSFGCQLSVRHSSTSEQSIPLMEALRAWSRGIPGHERGIELATVGEKTAEVAGSGEGLHAQFSGFVRRAEVRQCNAELDGRPVQRLGRLPPRNSSSAR